ncbi:MAG: hypothetical protein R2849_15965 [Thermomicrobiales bacterium]
MASWRVVLKRMWSDALIVAAAVVTIVLAVVLLAAGPIYADAVTVAGAQRTLVDAPVSEANVEINQRVAGVDYPAADDLVTGEAGRLIAPVGGEVVGSGQAVQAARRHHPRIASSIPQRMTVPGRRSSPLYQDVESHAALVDGRWPDPAAGLSRVVLPGRRRGARRRDRRRVRGHQPAGC